MISEAVYKVPAGKMIRIRVEYIDNKIKDINITGDFFLHPEEAIENIEEELKGVDLEEKRIIEKLEKTVKKHNIKFFGINEQSLARAIMVACGVGI